MSKILTTTIEYKDVCDVCDSCGNECIDMWTKDEAEKELNYLFGGHRDDTGGDICNPCFQKNLEYYEQVKEDGYLKPWIKST